MTIFRSSFTGSGVAIKSAKQANAGDLLHPLLEEFHVGPPAPSQKGNLKWLLARV